MEKSCDSIWYIASRTVLKQLFIVNIGENDMSNS